MKVIKVLSLCLLLVGMLALVSCGKKPAQDSSEIADGIPILRIEYNGKVYLIACGEEELFSGFELVQNVTEGATVWANSENEDIIFEKYPNNESYTVFIEQIFYYNDLINVDGNVYIGVNALLVCLEEPEMCGDLSKITKIDNIKKLDATYDTNPLNYENLGTINVGDDYGFPTQSMTCPKQSARLELREVYYHLEEGYIVLGRINKDNQITGSKFILNETPKN